MWVKSCSELMVFMFLYIPIENVSSVFSPETRSGDGVVDNTLDYQSRDRKIDPLLLRSFG